MKVRSSVKPICEKCKVIKRKGVVRVICENGVRLGSVFAYFSYSARLLARPGGPPHFSRALVSSGIECGLFWARDASSARSFSAVGEKCAHQVRSGPHWMSRGEKCGRDPGVCREVRAGERVLCGRPCHNPGFLSTFGARCAITPDC